MSAAAPTLAHQFLVFRLGGKDYGFEARWLFEAAVSVPFTEVPRTPTALIGVTQLHGKIVPVLDVARLLKAQAPQESGGFVVADLSGAGTFLAGFAVDRVVGFVKFPEAEVKPAQKAPVGMGIPYLKAWVGPLPVLDIERLVRDQVPQQAEKTDL